MQAHSNSTEVFSLDMDTWMALGTLLAVVVAVGFGTFAEIRLWLERRNRREELERAQAARVSAWLEGRTGQAHVVILNNSEEPIWRARVTQPGTSFHPVMESIVAPGDRYRRRVNEELNDSPIVVQLTFRDNNNRWWKRDRAGVLTREDDEPPLGPA